MSVLRRLLAVCRGGDPADRSGNGMVGRGPLPLSGVVYDGPSYLDLVRELGELSHREYCVPECLKFLHRRDAAQFLSLLVRNPRLIRQIARAADRISYHAEKESE